MKLRWQITKADIASVNALMAKQQNNGLVRDRINSNCATKKRRVTRQSFWREMVGMRLTSQQKSSPTSAVGRFGSQKPYPLTYERVLQAKNTGKFIQKTLEAAKGIRYAPTIGRELALNLEFLEAGEWANTLQQCNRLITNVDASTEAEVADYIDYIFLGFGPKQSRNLLQSLRLTRYEIPIDSRVTKWLNNSEFPVQISANALSDINYYKFIQGGIQLLCEKCGILPCVLDAAIFALDDGAEWDEFFSA